MSPWENNHHSHCSYPVALGREAARRADDKSATKSNQLQGETEPPPQFYCVPKWDPSGTLTLSHKTSFPKLPYNSNRSNSEEKNDQPECVAFDHERGVV